MSALQDLLSRALETVSHEVDMEADAEFKQLSHGEHDIFITAPLRLPQPSSTLLIIDCSHSASAANVTAAQPIGALLFPTLSPATALFSSSSPGCSIQPHSSIFAVGEVIIVAVASVPLPHCTHALAAKLLQHTKPPCVIMLRCDDQPPHAARLCSSSWTAQHAPCLAAIPPMAFPHVLEGLSAAVASHCEADSLPCCILSCPAAALASTASTIAGTPISFPAHAPSKLSPAPPLYI